MQTRPLLLGRAGASHTKARLLCRHALIGQRGRLAIVPAILETRTGLESIVASESQNDADYHF